MFSLWVLWTILSFLGIKDGTLLGVGLNAGLAGLGAITGGAGLLGTAAALNQSMNDGINANAEGKSALSTGGLQKGRDLATQRPSDLFRVAKLVSCWIALPSWQGYSLCPLHEPLTSIHRCVALSVSGLCVYVLSPHSNSKT